MSDAPLIPAPLYGLRTWRAGADKQGDCITSLHRGTPWPDGGAWLHAACDAREGHVAPAQDCECGVHAWHPRRSSAARILAARREIPGIVEAAGAAEIHEDGIRAARARPYAFVIVPGRNAALIGRLARRYEARTVELDGPAALIEWCRTHALGLDKGVVEDLLGLDTAAARRRARQRRAVQSALRIAAATTAAATLATLGVRYLNDPPGSQERYGRTGTFVAR